jgi:hypothetical protein
MDGTEGAASASRAPSRSSTTSSHSHAHAHRYHHAHCGTAKPVTPQVSSFLQERIQRRQAERKESGDLSVSAGSTREGDSPLRRSFLSATSRGHPSTGTGDDEKDGMGVREMEKVCLSGLGRCRTEN